MHLDRTLVLDMISKCFRADTTKLYGQNKLCQHVEVNPVYFEKSAVDIKRPNRIFLRCAPKENFEYRMQNNDIVYTIDYRIASRYSSDPNKAQQKIDDIDERMAYLIDSQMFTGSMFTDYYDETDTDTVYDVTYDNSSLVTEERDGVIIAECEGAIRVFVNRLAS